MRDNQTLLEALERIVEDVEELALPGESLVDAVVRMLPEWRRELEGRETVSGLDTLRACLAWSLLSNTDDVDSDAAQVLAFVAGAHWMEDALSARKVGSD